MTASTEVYRTTEGPAETARVCGKCGGYGSGNGRHETHRSTCEDFRPLVRHGRAYCPRCGTNVAVVLGAIGFHSHLMSPGTPCPGIGRECAS